MLNLYFFRRPSTTESSWVQPGPLRADVLSTVRSIPTAPWNGFKKVQPEAPRLAGLLRLIRGVSGSSICEDSSESRSLLETWTLRLATGEQVSVSVSVTGLDGLALTSWRPAGIPVSDECEIHSGGCSATFHLSGLDLCCETGMMSSKAGCCSSCPVLKC
jgi:hypothetical protein